MTPHSTATKRITKMSPEFEALINQTIAAVVKSVAVQFEQALREHPDELIAADKTFRGRVVE